MRKAHFRGASPARQQLWMSARQSPCSGRRLGIGSVCLIINLPPSSSANNYTIPSFHLSNRMPSISPRLAITRAPSSLRAASMYTPPSLTRAFISSSTISSRPSSSFSPPSIYSCSIHSLVPATRSTTHDISSRHNRQLWTRPEDFDGNTDEVNPVCSRCCTYLYTVKTGSFPVSVYVERFVLLQQTPLIPPPFASIFSPPRVSLSFNN